MHETEHKPPSVFRLVVVLALLMLLLAATVAVWYPSRNLGGSNPWIGLAIAAVKAALVGWFFMDLSDASPMTRLFSASGLFWLFIMIVITLGEVFSRGF